VNFGEEEFENYFKEFLRPQLVEMLFWYSLWQTIIVW
jgi:hypothetical protein